MANEWVFVQGNRKPYFAVQLLGSVDNLPIDLTTAAVTFYFRNQNARTAKVSAGSCTVTDPTDGEVEYRWGANDLDVIGTYDAEFRVTFSGSLTQSVIIPGVLVEEKLG